MSEKILTGFLVRGVTNIADIELLIFEMRKYILRRAKVCYKKLVEWQTERIVDEITLGQFNRPVNQTILDIAIGEVRRRMLYAERSMQETEFNLYIGLQVLVSKIDGQPCVYFKIIAPNDIYSKHLTKIKELEPCDITEKDLENKKGSKKALWDSLCDKYGADVPLMSSLLDYDQLTLEEDDFVFRTPEERAYDIAKEKILNHLLASYACDQEIPPNKLMEYMLQAFSRSNYQDAASAIEYEQKTLASILPVIDTKMVISNDMLPSDDHTKAEEAKADENFLINEKNSGNTMEER